MYDLRGTELHIWPLLGAGVAFAGGLIANRGRGKEAEKNRAFQSAEAGTQRKFQERMRNTEWQAGVEDMRRAGLNPALAYSQGGASAPMGASGSGAQADVEDVLGPSISSAMDIKRMKADLRLSYVRAGQVGVQNALLIGQQKEVEARTTSIELANQGARLGIPGLKNISRFEQGRAGESTSAVRALLRAIQGR